MHHKNSDGIASVSLTSFYIFIIKFAAKTFLVFRHSHYVRAIIIFISDPNSNSQSARMYKYHHTDEHVSIIMRRHDRDLFGIPSCSRFPDRCSTILYMRLIAVIGAADKSKSSSEEYQFARWPLLNVARH
ncbi:hypothetical protein ALC62_09976 [Cyphomyrmex costatus]|uniref:Uncharacterized protein n=1 Tax=Cyphomyrmex costatus TaxID=456900 RepID=A0A151IEQ4_9HYME|nr:hypothetical protein ALC62_09976 [Cyphomyrmex costatus]